MLSNHSNARRWRFPALLAALSLVAGLALQPVFAAKPPPAPPTPTFVDYAQCANGAPPSVSLACPDGWLNGILQAQNSHYSEDQVTPQRAEVNVPAGAVAEHTMTFTYQARKGSAETHAYDSLATWNWTQREADRCQGLAAIDCPSGAFSAFPIPNDPQDLAPSSAPSGTSTSTHMLPASTPAECAAYDPDPTGGPAGTYFPSRCMIMYGGTITGISEPVHDCVIGGDCDDASVDDYASVTVTYTVSSLPKKVQLLFGGHLAVGSEGGSRTWGSGNGASNIDGGPYHIKWIASDGSSIGNRDNQIMGSAIIFNDSSTSTQVKNTIGTADTADDTNIANDAHVALGTVAYDTATLSGTNSSTAGGTVTYYYSTVATCDPLAATTTSIGSVTVTNGIVPPSADVTLSTAGTYEFWAVYGGDATHGESSSTCGSETVIVDQATPAPHSTPVVKIQDTFTVSGFTAGATGNVLVGLYTVAGCGSGQVGTDASFAVSGAINGTLTGETLFVTASANTTYYYKISYAGDTNNDDFSSCAESVAIGAIVTLP
jgi:hypothetical protein